MLGIKMSRMEDVFDQARQETAITLQRQPGATVYSTQKLNHELLVGHLGQS